MIILAIETSCDDTAIAILKIPTKGGSASGGKNKIEVLSNVISSQVNLHAKYGGVYPSLAKREHHKNLPVVFKKALSKSGLKISKIDVIAVTAGPGLEPCLWEGINFAKKLAEKLKIPIIPVNHIEAHILVNLIGQNKNIFPAICLVVSGGHTQIILMEKIGIYKILGETLDDAAGECFDKTARILGLGYPGGPIIASKATKFDRERVSICLPKPMIYQKNYDFSFSGLKTAVLYDFKKRPNNTKKSQGYINEMCSAIQQTIIDVLTAKTLKAVKDCYFFSNKKIKSVILGGGVSANEELRKQMNEKVNNLNLNISFFVPPKDLSTDNAVMVGFTAFCHWKNLPRGKAGKKTDWQNIKANANLRIDEKI